MITKNVKKNIFRKLAEAGKGVLAKYVRLTDDVIAYGNFVVIVTTEGYEAFVKKGDQYVPVSFHCEHSSGYAHEIWEGETYHIIKREVNYEDADEIVLWENLWNMPHIGHYAFDPECI